MNIIVTGAGKGIGFEIVKQLSSNKDHHIIGISRDVFQLKSLPDNVTSYRYDLTQLPSDELTDIVRTVFDDGVDILINNAGLLINKPYHLLTNTDFDQMMIVNLKAPHLLIQSLLPLFNPKAHIVNISSMGGFQGSSKFAGLSLYSTFKGALCTLTECLAEELKTHEISVNALCLGAVETEMLKQAFPNYTAPKTASDMAKYIVNFALEGNSYFNGKIIPVSSTTP